MTLISQDLINRLAHAVRELKTLSPLAKIGDDEVDDELRAWLDHEDEPLPWACQSRVTADEWFFVTTLYGTMSLNGQRTHIRRFFRPLFVEAARRDVRNFTPGIPQFAGLRWSWMSKRLCKMGAILRERGLSMADYVDQLRQLDAKATPGNPIPAVDAIMRDHDASEGKTLCVFVRDCVLGNCFPIDSRVEKELKKRGLPADERQLVASCLVAGLNPRAVARLFYDAGGDPSPCIREASCYQLRAETEQVPPHR